MEQIALFIEPPKAVVETTYPADLDSGCRRCALSQRSIQHRCLSADGDPGGLLVLTDFPSSIDDRAGRPAMGETGTLIRALVAEHWKGPVVYDNAVKCAAGTALVSPETVARCRPYLAAILRDAAPTRILALGKVAIEGLLGRNIDPLSTRRGYAYLSTGVPVLFSFAADRAAHNRHLRAYLREDITWALTQQPQFGPQWKAIANVVVTEADALQAERALSGAPWVAFDTETAGLPFSKFQVVCAALFAKGSSEGWVWGPEAMRDPGARAVLARLSSNPRLGKVGNNLKWDLTAVELEFGTTARGFHGDNRLIRKVIQADADGDLDAMTELVGMGGAKAEAKEHLELAVRKLDRITGERGTTQLSMLGTDIGFLREDVFDSYRPGIDSKKAFAFGLLPRGVLLRYVCRDALASRMLQEWAEATLAVEAPALRRTWEIIIKPAAEAVRQVEQWGVAVDRTAMRNFQGYLTQRQDELKTKMMQWGDFDPGNAHDIGRHLFDKLKLPGATKTDSGRQYATDAETLEKVAAITKHPLPGMVVDYKKLDKMMGTYALGMERHIRDDGRIHTKLLLDGTETGRLSSQGPNLQNVPRDADTAEGCMARNCFIASPGHRLLGADYSQLELRIAAALSGDEAMQEIFKKGIDFHQGTAEFIAPIVWGLKPEQVTKRHRSAAKSFNFGIMYGMSDEAISALAGCSVQEAAKIRAAVMGKFVKLRAFIEKCRRYARKNGYCWTWWDGERARRRPLWAIAGSEYSPAKITAENSSFNTPIQGTGSDFCLMSLVAVVNWILNDAVPARLVLSVHDSLLLEVREDCFDEAAQQLKAIMTGWNSLGVPLTIDMEQGYAWGSMTKMAA